MPAIRLSVHSPSDTTTQYTVSNAPVRDTSLALSLWIFGVAARISLALCTLGIMGLQLSLMTELGEQIDSPRLVDLEERWLKHVKSSSETLMGVFIVLVCTALLYVLSRRDYIQESILVIRSLGIQTSTSSSSYLSLASTRFIPTSQIQDIFIHEAFRGHEVRFYLAIVVEGEEEAVVVFPKLLPRRKILEKVWRGTRQVLWNLDDDEYKSTRVDP